MKKSILPILRMIYVFWIMASVNNVIMAQCYTKNLEASQREQLVVTSSLDTLNQRYITLKINQEFLYSFYQFDLITKAYPVSLEFYSGHPCESGILLGEFQLEDNLQIDFNPQYRFIKVISKEGNHAKVKIITKFDQEIAGCNFKLNKINSIHDPLVIKELINGSNCFELCNSYCKGLQAQYDPTKLNLKQPIKWLKLALSEFHPLIVEISINSNDLNSINILAFEINDDEITYRENIEYSSNFIYQSYDSDYLLLGIYDRIGATGNFDICINKYQVDYNCIDFFGESGQTLDAIYTSKNSPLEGPYKYGEKVTFSYKLLNWMPIKNNWVHGIKVSYGEGWSGLFTDELERPLSLNSEQGAIDTSLVRPDLGYYHADLTVIDTIRDIKNLVLPAWYVTEARHGPNGPYANYKWGNRFESYKGSTDQPLFEIEFTMIADTTDNCDVPLDGFVEIKLTTDYDTGMWYESGCVNQIPLVKDADIICCQANISPELQDSLFCDGDTFELKEFIQDSASYEIVNNPINSYHRNYLFDKNEGLQLLNEEKKIDTILLNVQIYNEFCPSSIDVPIHVKGYESANLCVDDLQVKSDVKNCLDQDELNSSIDFVIFPNPTFGLTDINIENDTDYSQWTFSVFDQRGLKVYTKSIYLNPRSNQIKHVDFSGLKSANYILSISNDNMAKAHSLIISF